LISLFRPCEYLDGLLGDEAGKKEASRHFYSPNQRKLRPCLPCRQTGTGGGFIIEE